MCMTCPCLLPANGHGDRRNKTYEDLKSRDFKLSHSELMDATETKVGPATVEKVRQNIARARRMIDEGKLDPKKRS